MVLREPSLAELLADDMGNLRPDAVEAIIGDPPRRVNRPRRWAIRCLFLASASILLIIIIKALSGEVDKGRYVATTQIQPKAPSADQIGKDRSKNRGKDKSLLKKTNESLATFSFGSLEDATRLPKTNKRNPLNNRPLQIMRHLGKAKVFGFDVNIRQFPRVGSPIVRQTNQGEVFPVNSFSNGWYEIALGEDQAAFIFGAYLLPLDFKLSSHRVGIAKDRTKLLLSKDDRRDWFQVILPDGTRRYVGKNDVQVVKSEIDETYLPSNNKRNSRNDKQLQTRRYLGKAKVFGYDVNIRRFPRVGSPIVRQTNQGEVFLVNSFSSGWYEIVLGKNQVAFIFGAYLLPVDFKVSSHWIGLARDRTKLLLAADYRPDRFQVILPDGTKHYIRKKNVQIVR